MHREIVSGMVRAVACGALVVCGVIALPPSIEAQALVDPTLNVSTVVSGLEQPIAMAFIGPDDMLVTEKASGQVKRVTAGAVAGVVLDLAVNSSSERGLLGIALHPRFPRVPYVYLYNTESTTGADSNVLAEVPLLGNRVDRFKWDGSTLTFDRNIIRLRAFQNDRNNVADPTLPVLRGNHNGGVLRFGPDRKLYIIYGDNGRRGLTQNNLAGPVPDDDFGGPLPDDAHFTGVVLRLDDDGGTPRDNPFFFGFGRRGDASGFDERQNTIGRLGVEVLRNLQRTFAYGVRNSFGMTFDPKTGYLWTTENGGRAFDEINRVVPGFNGGWVQVMGPLSRVAGVQGDRGWRRARPQWPGRASAAALPCDPHRRDAGGGESPPAPPPGLPLARPRIQLEARRAAGRPGLHPRRRAREGIRRRSDRGIGGGPAHQRGQPLSVPVESPADRVQVRRSRPPGQGGRQPRARRFRDRRR